MLVELNYIYIQGILNLGGRDLILVNWNIIFLLFNIDLKCYLEL